MDTDDTAGGSVGPAVARMVLGTRMRRLREARGITCANAASAIRGSHSKISRMELGRTGFKRQDVADLLTFYSVSDETERNGLLALADKANTPGWLHEYRDVLSRPEETRLALEQSASIIRCYENQFVPSLLQTPEYARALIRLRHPDVTPSEIRRRTALLARRQEALHRPQPCTLWAVLDEAALRRRPGSVAITRRQLLRLAELCQLPNLTIQVIPFRAGVAAGGAVTLLRFAEPEVSDVIYLDQFTGALHLSKPADVEHYTRVLDRLCTRAEQPTKARAFLRRLADEIAPAEPPADASTGRGTAKKR